MFKYEKGSANGTWKGFTLIELLVVVAIISVLAAILFPVFARARENARRASCLSNLKQIGLALMQYVQDYDERMPFQVGTSGTFQNFAVPSGANTSYFYKLYPYSKSWELFRCPSATINPAAGDKADAVNNTSYLINGVLATGSTLTSGISRHIASIPEPATTIVLQDYKYNVRHSYMRPSMKYAATSTLNAQYEYWLPNVNYSNLHFDGGNLLFADGHAKWRKLNTICTAEFGLGVAWGGPSCGTNSTSGAVATALY